MNFVKRCLKLIKNLAKNMNKDLATKIPNKNTVDNPREKFQLMVLGPPNGRCW